MGLVVALDNDGKAEGQLFWDDGQSIGEYKPQRACILFRATLSQRLSMYHWDSKTHPCVD